MTEETAKEDLTFCNKLQGERVLQVYLAFTILEY